MAIQIINDPNRTFASSLANAVGSGLQSGIASLAQLKLEDLSARKQQERQIQFQNEQRQQLSQMYQKLGLPEELSSTLPFLPQDLQKNVLSSFASMGGLNIPGMEQGAQQGTNIFQSPEQKLKQQQFALQQQAESRKGEESLAKTELSKAKTNQIAQQGENEKLFRQYNEQQAKLRNELTQAKNQLEDKKSGLSSKSAEAQARQQDQIERQTLAKQKAIDTKLKPYRTNLDKRYTASESILSKANEMLQLLNSGEVNTGIAGKYQPLFLSNDASNRFSGLADDIANELTGLTTGTQTISKIKFNQQRKPNLSQSTATQIERTNDLVKEANKVVLENDIANYFINQNSGENPSDLQQKVHGLIKKIGEPPLKGPNNEEGQILDDPKKGISWIVSGPVLRFNGFI
jgi:hypothetical protein